MIEASLRDFLEENKSQVISFFKNYRSESGKGMSDKCSIVAYHWITNKSHDYIFETEGIKKSTIKSSKKRLKVLFKIETNTELLYALIYSIGKTSERQIITTV